MQNLKHAVTELRLDTDVLLHGHHKWVCFEERAANLHEVLFALSLVTVGAETCHRIERELLTGIIVNHVIESNYRLLPFADQFTKFVCRNDRKIHSVVFADNTISPTPLIIVVFSMYGSKSDRKSTRLNSSH